MPHYPVRNKETGEEKELWMTMQDYEKWKEENEGWEKDWSKGVGGACEVGEWQSRLVNKHPGWGEIMQGVKRAAPRNKSITEKY
jgi:hypothetical protein